jgi:8-oxo-dGTP pyrophosphatase MutT (NUDIX family)
MPAVSPAQHRLMEAVAHSASFAAKAGVPQKVGREFVGQDEVKVQAAGTLFVTPEGRVLLCKRAPSGDHHGEWALPGGKVEDGETPLQAAMREALEELAVPAYPGEGRFFSRTQSNDGVDFSTFVCAVPGEFTPTLCPEHTAFGWFPLDDLPANLHPGVKASLGPLALGHAAEDMKPSDWKGLVDGFLKFIGEEEQEPEHAHDAAMAFDLASARTYTVEGHLHVSRTPISKANVCEYYGREIPGSEALGLEPGRKYRLLRCPVELAKAAATSNGKPLLITHESAEADMHPFDLTVGSLGTDAEFVDPYLYNSLSVWESSAIRGIEDKSRRQLSAGYRYTPDMTPGIFRGAPYDGVMRNIIFNHEALVPAGRAGADILVGDEKPEEEPTQNNGEIIMKTVLSRKGLYLAASVGALLAPRLAQDASIDLGHVFDGVSAKNWDAKKPEVVKALRSVKLAKDQAIEPVLLALDAAEKEDVPEGLDADPSSGLPMNAAEKAAKDAKDAEEAVKKEAEDKKANDRKARDEKVDNFKKGKDAKTCAAIDALMGELDGEDEAADPNADDKKGKDAKGLDKKGLDAALAEHGQQLRDQFRSAAEAREFVEPFVGKVGLAMDSAVDIYKLALDELKVDLAGVPKDAATYKAILKAQPAPGSQMKTLALDEAPAAVAEGTSSRFGGVIDRISA